MTGGRTGASAPTEGYKGAGAERNPPVTASPCQPPLGKGAYKDGEYGLRGLCAPRPRNDGVLHGDGAKKMRTAEAVLIF